MRSPSAAISVPKVLPMHTTQIMSNVLAIDGERIDDETDDEGRQRHPPSPLASSVPASAPSASQPLASALRPYPSSMVYWRAHASYERFMQDGVLRDGASESSQARKILAQSSAFLTQ